MGRFVGHLLVEVFAEEVAKEPGDAGHPTSTVLSGPEMKLASGFGNRLGNTDAGADEITSSTPEGGGLSPAEPAVAEPAVVAQASAWEHPADKGVKRRYPADNAKCAKALFRGRKG